MNEGNKDFWPCVGDEVVYDGAASGFSHLKGQKLNVIGVCKNSADGKVLTMEHPTYGVVAINDGDWIKKTKTPEEELRDDLTDLIMRALDAGVNDDTLAKSIMSKYNITKKES